MHHLAASLILVAYPGRCARQTSLWWPKSIFLLLLKAHLTLLETNCDQGLTQTFKIDHNWSVKDRFLMTNV